MRASLKARPLLKSETHYVFRLQALWALSNLELHSLALIQAAITIALDCGEMDKNILSRLALDEAESLAGIEPLHCSLFSHLFTHFSFKLFVLLDRLQP